jgi:chemotaxis protein histidine kinase CheA
MDFDAIITGIRKAIYGREVREYIASSMEWTRDFVNQSIANIKELLRQAEAARDAAKASQDAAKVSETNAKASENAAKASENAAASSASAAAGSASAAKTSETNAKASENAAKTSETKAKTSETNAKASENAAKTSEANAKASENAAKSSEMKAATSAANAKTSETNAKASADSMGTSVATCTTKAKEAEASAGKAKTSEGNAKTSEGNAKASENEARQLVEAAKKVVNTDKTLTIDGAPADAKTVGDKFKSIKTDWNSVTDKPSTFPPSEHTHSYITNGGDATAITGAIGTPGLSLQQAYNNGYPTTYGNVLSIGGTGDGQILAGWSSSNNGIERLYYRNRRDVCDTWSAWKAIAFTDDSNALSAYPVGAIYISTSSTSPASLFGGTWESIASERVLMGVSSSHGAGSTVSAGLPNITGVLKDLFVSSHFNQSTGVFKRSYCSSFSQQTDRSDWLGWAEAQFYASDSNSIYGNASTVQPAAYYVYMWRRTA